MRCVRGEGVSLNWLVVGAKGEDEGVAIEESVWWVG